MEDMQRISRIEDRLDRHAEDIAVLKNGHAEMRAAVQENTGLTREIKDVVVQLKDQTKGVIDAHIESEILRKRTKRFWLTVTAAASGIAAITAAYSGLHDLWPK